MYQQGAITKNADYGIQVRERGVDRSRGYYGEDLFRRFFAALLLFHLEPRPIPNAAAGVAVSA